MKSPQDLFNDCFVPIIIGLLLVLILAVSNNNQKQDDLAIKVETIRTQVNQLSGLCKNKTILEHKKYEVKELWLKRKRK